MNTNIIGFEPAQTGTKTSFDPLGHTTRIVKKRSARSTQMITIPGLWSVGVNDQWDIFTKNFERKLLPCPLRGRTVSSPRCLDGVSLMDYVSDVKSFLQKNGPSILIGHSAGGYIAQIITMLEPELVTGLVLLGSAMPRAKGVEGIDFQAKFISWRYILAMATGGEYCLLPKHQRFVRGRTHAIVERESGRATREVLTRRFRVRPAKCPVLLVTGDSDQFCDVGRQQNLNHFHRGTLKVVDGDHMFHCDPIPARETCKIIDEWCYRQMI